MILNPPDLDYTVLRVDLKRASSRGGDDQVLWLDILGEKMGHIPFPGLSIMRDLPISPRSQKSVEFIKSHLRVCNLHRNCHIPSFSGSTGEQKEATRRPSRLLEIINTNCGVGLILRETTDSEYKYTALSHCWGTPQEALKIPVLSRDNLKERLSGILSVSELSKTFQDAVDLTNKLGLKYIWIDSLCIIQGDKGDWQRACSKMAHVYGETYLVIGVAYAKDGNRGLYAPRQAAHHVEFKTPTGDSIKMLVKDVSKWREGHAV